MDVYKNTGKTINFQTMILVVQYAVMYYHINVVYHQLCEVIFDFASNYSTNKSISMKVVPYYLEHN